MKPILCLRDRGAMIRTAAFGFIAATWLSGCNGDDSSTDIAANSPTPPEPSDVIAITALSNRADLISGGDALVRVNAPQGVSLEGLEVSVNDRDVTDVFTAQQPNQSIGLIDGLVVGQNVVVARAADGSGARLIITNHPKGGPVFAGPQVQPWLCATADNGLGTPIDEHCNAPTKLSYLYQPEGANAGEYEAYDPDNPPSDVAMTTTDEGRTVPYIIQVEEGTLNRTIYRVMVPFDPTRPWTAITPQEAWNRKLFVAFGGGCGTPHVQRPPNERTVLFGNTAGDGDIQQPELLSRGWMTTATGLNTLNNNCNETVSAEALMMVKEHIVETYGQIRRTVSVGGSGGSVQQHYIASAYPGLLDGIVPTQSFPDLWNMVWDAAECYLVTNYMLSPSALTSLFTPLQQLAITGKTGPVACTQFVSFFGDAFDPQNRGAFQTNVTVRTGCELSASQMYDPATNPTGARCSVQDYQNAIWGKAGPRNAAPLPYDNVGVQYGLLALQQGSISAEQFVTLNANIGGFNNEGEFTQDRTVMDVATATTMYRAARTSDPRQIAKVPIVDIREVLLDAAPDLLSDMHQPYNSHVMRARLDAVNGTHANQVFWLLPPENMDIAAALAVDRWLDAVDADDSNLSREQKIIRNKPADIVDTCWIGGEPVTDAATCEQQYPYGSDARIMAGGPLRNDVRKCQLKPLRRDDYSVAFTDSQWHRLQAAFPTGVCDWTKPSVGYQPSIPWMTYADGPGGEPLGPAPTSSPL